MLIQFDMCDPTYFFYSQSIYSLFFLLLLVSFTVGGNGDVWILDDPYVVLLINRVYLVTEIISSCLLERLDLNLGWPVFWLASKRQLFG